MKFVIFQFSCLDGEMVSGNNSGNALLGRMRGLSKDMQRRISRLRVTGATPPAEQTPEPDSSSASPSSTVPLVTTGSRSSLSGGETDEVHIQHPLVFIGKARALIDYTPSPYDKEGLRFKRGDIVDIIDKHPCGLWRGHVDGRVGTFKFINVELIVEGHKSQRKPKMAAKAPQHIIPDRPASLHDLLKRIKCEEHLSVLVVNGWDSLDTFKELEKEDLVELGISRSDHQDKILSAVQHLRDLDDDDDDESTKSQQSESQMSPLEMRVPAAEMLHQQTPRQQKSNEALGQHQYTQHEQQQLAPTQRNFPSNIPPNQAKDVRYPMSDYEAKFLNARSVFDAGPPQKKEIPVGVRGGRKFHAGGESARSNDSGYSSSCKSPPGYIRRRTPN